MKRRLTRLNGTTKKKQFDEEEQLNKKFNFMTQGTGRTDAFLRANSLVQEQKKGKFAGLVKRLDTINERKQQLEEEESLENVGRSSYRNTDAPVGNRGAVNERSSQK
jgi:hypothetical protein